jgi:hypothetical protein
MAEADEALGLTREVVPAAPAAAPATPAARVTPRPSGLPSLDALVQQASAVPARAYVQDTIDTLRDIQGRKEAELAPMRADVKSRFDTDQAEVDRRYTGIEAPDVKPWTRELPQTDPMRAFGSAGSMFAMIASAFTNAPMISALNGAAGAMNAIRENDLLEYKTSFDAWKSNTKLALDRHDLQHRDYRAALDRMKVNAAEGNAMLTAAAAKYGDEQLLALKEAGLMKELDDTVAARASSAMNLIQIMPKLQEFGIRNALLLADEDWTSGDPSRQQAAYQRVQMTMMPFTASDFDPKRAATRQFLKNNPNATTDDMVTFVKSLDKQGARTMAGVKLEMLDKWEEEFRQRNGREPTVDESEAALKRINSTGLTGNQMAQYRMLVVSADRSLDAMDRVSDVLQRYRMAAGLTGSVRRGMEAVGNLLGSNETDLSQFRRDIEIIKGDLGRVLTGSQGRILASDANRMQAITAGLEMTATTADTLRAMEELRKITMDVRRVVENVMKGDLSLDGGAPAATPAAATTAQPEPKDWFNTLPKAK